MTGRQLSADRVRAPLGSGTRWSWRLARVWQAVWGLPQSLVGLALFLAYIYVCVQRFFWHKQDILCPPEDVLVW